MVHRLLSVRPERRSHRYVAAELWAWARRRRRRAVVGGRSMMPTLQPGWFVLVDPFAGPVPGDVVTVRHPEDRDVVMIKRLGGFRDGGVWVESDNPAEGTDSREFGPLPIDHLVGRVTLVLDDVRRPLAEASSYEEPS